MPQLPQGSCSGARLAGACVSVTLAVSAVVVTVFSSGCRGCMPAVRGCLPIRLQDGLTLRNGLMRLLGRIGMAFSRFWGHGDVCERIGTGWPLLRWCSIVPVIAVCANRACREPPCGFLCCAPRLRP